MDDLGGRSDGSCSPVTRNLITYPLRAGCGGFDEPLIQSKHIAKRTASSSNINKPPKINTMEAKPPSTAARPRPKPKAFKEVLVSDQEDDIDDLDLDGDVPMKEAKGRERKEVTVLIEKENVRKRKAAVLEELPGKN